MSKPAIRGGRNRRPIAVIGAGFSGTMTALHLLREVDAPILLCERGPNVARGAAYSTPDPLHLLNVRAANMSAYPNEPEHFSAWLGTSEQSETERHVGSAGTFVSRSVYGRYLSDLLMQAISRNEQAPRLEVVPDEVVDLVPAREGYTLVLAGGGTRDVAGAILAVGNLRPTPTETGRVIEDPWQSSLSECLVDGRPVVIMGTGLTMVDIVSQLAGSGFGGPVIAISRRGLLSRTHVPAGPWPLPAFTPDEQQSPLRLLRRIRREIALADVEGIAWHGVIDSLRPVTSRIWRGLPLAGQRRFLRHLQPWWDVHRHRMAPPIGQRILTLLSQGYLQVRAGQVLSVEENVDAAIVTYRPRYGSRTIVLEAQRVINATGAPPASCVNDPLIAKLLTRNLIRLDPNRLGVDVDEGFAASNGEGETTPNLWALGPIVRGALWECTAVPDIRRHALELAKTVSDRLMGVRGSGCPSP